MSFRKSSTFSRPMAVSGDIARPPGLGSRVLSALKTSLYSSPGTAAGTAQDPAHFDNVGNLAARGFFHAGSVWSATSPLEMPPIETFSARFSVDSHPFERD